MCRFSTNTAEKSLYSRQPQKRHGGPRKLLTPDISIGERGGRFRNMAALRTLFLSRLFFSTIKDIKHRGGGARALGATERTATKRRL